MPPFVLSILALDAADDDTIVQWTEFHGLRSRFDLRCAGLTPQDALAFGFGS